MRNKFLPLASPHSQRGLSFWAFVWGAAFLVLITIVLIKSLPVYMNDHKLKSALEAVAEEDNAKTASRAQLLRSLERRLNVDYADDYVDLNKAFQVKKLQNARELSLNYEVVVGLAGNAYLLFDFKNEIDVPL